MTTSDTRAEQILRDLHLARTAHDQIILTGAAIDDLFVDRGGRALPLQVLLRQLCEDHGLNMVVYSTQAAPQIFPADSIQMTIPQDEPPADQILAAIRAVQAGRRPTVLLVDFADLLLPPGTMVEGQAGGVIQAVQEVTTNTLDWAGAGHTLVLVDRGSGIVPRVSSITGMRVVDLSAPRRAEMLHFIRGRQASQRSTPLALAPDLTDDRAASLAGGLMIRDVHGMALCSTRENPVTADQLAEAKGEVLQRQSHGTLEAMHDGAALEDVAGMEPVKLLLRRLAGLGRVSEQFVLVGPPGTGKTYCAQAVARAMGIPLVAFRGIMGEGLLGQAEHNAERAVALLRAILPVGLFFDEVDQGPLRARSAGGQTSNEAHLALRATLLNALSDPTSGISVIATSNVGSHLDPAAVSRMRFLPVLFATAPELTTILRVQARRGQVPLNSDPTDMFENYLDTGRVLDGRSTQRLLDKAHMLARERNSDTVESIDLERALASKMSNDLTEGALYSTLDALLMADDADALPWVAARTLGQPAVVPRYLREFVRADLTFDEDAARMRMSELRGRNVYA